MSSSSTRPGTSTSRRMLSSSPSRGAPGPRSCSRPASPSSICPSPGGADATTASGFPELCRPHSDARDLMAILRAKIEAKEFGDYVRDPTLRAAVERKFEIVGEALSQLASIDPALELTRAHAGTH